MAYGAGRAARRNSAAKQPRKAVQAAAAAVLCLILQCAAPADSDSAGSTGAWRPRWALAPVCGRAACGVAGCVSRGPVLRPRLHEVPRVASAGRSKYQEWAEEKLRSVIPDIQYLVVEDVSDGHTATGFTDGSGRSLNPHGVELKVEVVADSFGSVSTLGRQRLVHDALREGLATGAIHSLPRLRTWTPSEWQAKLATRNAAPRVMAVAMDEDWLGTVNACVD